jgi:hypothetical protein
LSFFHFFSWGKLKSNICNLCLQKKLASKVKLHKFHNVLTQQNNGGETLKSALLQECQDDGVVPKDDAHPEGDVEPLLDVGGSGGHAPGVRQNGALQPLRVLQGVGRRQVATKTVT